MTKRRPRFKNDKFTPKILDVYKRARALYDGDDDPVDNTDEFEKLQHELNVLLSRTAPWLTDIFDTVDMAQPQDWLIKLGGEQCDRWHEARKIMTALEQATAA